MCPLSSRYIRTRQHTCSLISAATPSTGLIAPAKNATGPGTGIVVWQMRAHQIPCMLSDNAITLYRSAPCSQEGRLGQRQ